MSLSRTSLVYKNRDCRTQRCHDQGESSDGERRTFYMSISGLKFYIKQIKEPSNLIKKYTSSPAHNGMW